MIQPLGHRVLVKELDTEETLPGGKIIMLDDTLKYHTQSQAEVISAGKDCDPRLKKGAWILHKPFARAKGPQDNVYWVNEEDVVAVIS